MKKIEIISDIKEIYASENYYLAEEFLKKIMQKQQSKYTIDNVQS